MVVEGIADIVFMKDFIEVHYGYTLNSKIKNSQIVEIELTKGDDIIIIYQLFGKNPDNNIIKNLQQRINSFSATAILCIFDSDNDFVIAKSNLKSIFDFDTNISENNFYLFPNNRDLGDLEVLLEKVVVNENIMVCWKNFEECIIASNDSLTIPARKSKIHTYLEVLNPDNDFGKKNCKEINRDYKDKTKWKLNDTNIIEINNLLSFLNQYIKNE